MAALAVGRKVGLPPRLITIIQGEGLLNDATALTILSVAVAAATGDGFSAPSAFGKFVVAAAGGVAVGAAVAYGVRGCCARSRGDPLIANADLARHPVRRVPARPRRCTSPACSRSSSPG